MHLVKFVRQLKKDPTGLIGISVLGIAIIISIFGANLRPDSSLNANNQHPEIAKLSPGTEVLFIQELGHESASFFKRMFFGGDEIIKEIPADSVWFVGDKLHYYRTSTHGRIAVELVHDKPRNQLVLESRKFFLGTDKLGRDVLSRLMGGTIVSLSVGLISVAISLLIGIVLGAFAGYFGGWIDNTIMWFVNVVWSIPTLLMVMAITLALGKGFVQVFIAVGLTMWVEVARVVRGRFIELKQQDYVMAAKLLNAPSHKIIFSEMLPNAVGPLVVIAAGNFSTAILLEAGLSFLGIGAQVPMPSWGGMIKSHFAYLTTDAAFIPLVPGFAIMLLVLSFIWIGNTLRDSFDVRA